MRVRPETDADHAAVRAVNEAAFESSMEADIVDALRAKGLDLVSLVAERDGVVGLIMAQHQLNDGIRRARTKSFDESFEVIRRHIDKIAEITGDHRHVALGTDFDGFIKPTMSGVESAEDLAKLEHALRIDYPADADAILSGNALRVVMRVLARRPAQASREHAG